MRSPRLRRSRGLHTSGADGEEWKMSDEVIEELCRIKDDMARPAADLRHRLQEEGRRIVDLHALRESGQRQLAPRSVPSRRP